MKKYTLTVSYDGTDYQGWQVQPHRVTIANCMQEVFSRVFGSSITLLGASRTDTGVHALGQVAMFQSSLEIELEQLRAAWNSGLPNAIHIRTLSKASPTFYPLAHVREKIYYYHLFLDEPLPFVARYGWYYECINQVDFSFFKQALQLFVGEHDFGSFCKVPTEKSTVRSIDTISVHRFSRYGIVQVVIRGKSFLRFQIRRMIGAALGASRRKDFSLTQLKKILDNPNPIQTLLKADARGLCLRKVIYEDV